MQAGSRAAANGDTPAAAGGGGPAVEVHGLRKVYPGGAEAARDFDFHVGTGEVFGLLGPNGAGKSTTIGMLTTAIKPTSGTARLAGFDVVTNPIAARSVSSVVFQEPVLDKTLTGRPDLDLHARLWGVPASAAVRKIAELTAEYGLSELIDRPAGTFSGGQRRRLEIARALIRNSGPVPRRANGRAGHPHPLLTHGSDQRPARPHRHDHRADHPPPRRGRTALRPCRCHAPRQDHGFGQACPPARRLRRRARLRRVHVPLAEILANRIPTQEEYVGLTPVVAILPWFLAGSLFPITALPAWLAWVARVLPTTHVLALLRYGAVPSVGLASGLMRATTASTSATAATPPLWQRHRQRRSPISQTAGRPTTGPSRHAAATQPTRAAPRPLSPRDGRPRRDIHGWTLLAVQFVR